MTSVVVIIPTLNSTHVIGDCLRSLESQTYADLEILVVDGGSTDGTVEHVRQLGHRILIGPFGRSTARRLGVSHSDSDFLLFMDSDQTAEPTLVEQCVGLIRSEKAAAVCIPETDFGYGFWRAVRDLDRRLTAAPNLSYPRFYLRSAYERAGGHLEGLENYMEDRDLMLRLRSTGMTIVNCSASLRNHLGHLNPIELGQKGYRSASDASQYYGRLREGQEKPWTVIRPRVVRLFEPRVLGLRDFRALIGLPIYFVPVYGPRLVRAIWQSRGIRHS